MAKNQQPKTKDKPKTTITRVQSERKMNKTELRNLIEECYHVIALATIIRDRAGNELASREGER